MFTSTATSTTYFLLAAAATVYGAPIFNSRDLASRAATQQDGELAQGANFFFKSLTIESACSREFFFCLVSMRHSDKSGTASQIACIGNGLAICSPESDWEVQLCFTPNTSCFATPKRGDIEGIVRFRGFRYCTFLTSIRISNA